MPLYRYKAADADGAVTEGEAPAASRDALIRQIQAEGRVPLEAREITAQPPRTRRLFGGSRRVTRADVTVLTVQLATLLEAGMSLDRALGMVERIGEREPVREMVSRIRDAVRGGKDFSAALAAEGDLFPPFYRNMVRAGEASGTLELTLARLAEFLEHAAELREMVVSALIYPLLLVGLAGISLVLMLTYVVPQFAVMFEDAGATLPLATRILMAVSDALQRFGWVIPIVVAGGAWWLRAALRDPLRRLRLDRALLATPGVGALITAFETARFTRTLGTLLANGVSLLAALGIAREAVVNRRISEGLARVTEDVRAGGGLARPLARAGVFPPLVAQMLEVGEESGGLDAVLERLAAVYEREVRTSVRRLIALVEPALILTLGLIIAGIIMSILAAILRVNELAF